VRFEPDWPGRILPLVVNVLQLRCRPRRVASSWPASEEAILSYPEDLKVAIVGTGAISHHIIGALAGFQQTRPEDSRFLELNRQPIPSVLRA